MYVHKGAQLSLASILVLFLSDDGVCNRLGVGWSLVSISNIASADLNQYESLRNVNSFRLDMADSGEIICI